MTRSFNGLGLALATALVLSGCTVTTDGSRANGSSGPDGGADLPGDAPQGGGQKSGELSFSPANVPADAALAATGEWIFNTDTCGSTKVTIDTAKGTVSCAGQPKGAFTFKAITQVDTSQGTLTAGLFVTRRLVIEPSMVVDVVGNRPLVIVALETATIQGALRAAGVAHAANGGGHDGAANERGGGLGGGAAASDPTGAGGGGYCGLGGGASSGGKAFGRATNSPLVGGASGGGGTGAGGAGGGALEIVAGASIEVSGTGVIAVPGGGGDWRSAGGGAGGAILLEAPVVSVFGTLSANGGGGAGSHGVGANASSSAEAAPGGKPQYSGDVPGGAGAADVTIAGQSGENALSSLGSGGGGGGGVGWIRLNTKAGSATIGATAVISPALSTPCATQGTPAAR